MGTVSTLLTGRGDNTQLLCVPAMGSHYLAVYESLKVRWLAESVRDFKSIQILDVDVMWHVALIC